MYRVVINERTSDLFEDALEAIDWVNRNVETDVCYEIVEIVKVGITSKKEKQK